MQEGKEVRGEKMQERERLVLTRNNPFFDVGGTNAKLWRTKGIE